MEQKTKLREHKRTQFCEHLYSFNFFSITKYFCIYTITSSEQIYGNMLYLMDIKEYQIRIHGMLIMNNISLKNMP